MVTKRTVAKRKTAARAAATRTRTRTAGAKPSALATAATVARGAAAGVVAAVAERLPGGQRKPDPLVLLESDHRRFEALLKQGDGTTERAVKRRTQLLNTLTSALNVHELIEEKVLYPALEPHK